MKPVRANLAVCVLTMPAISVDRWSFHVERSLTLVAAVAAVARANAPAFAHPRLLSANPVADAVVAIPARLQLSFSETLFTQVSGGDLAMIDMPGM